MKKSINITLSLVATLFAASFANANTSNDADLFHNLEAYYAEVKHELIEKKMESIREMTSINFDILLADIDPVHATAGIGGLEGLFVSNTGRS